MFQPLFNFVICRSRFWINTSALKPYDCAGSAKSEGMGIILLEKIESEDPTALIGLPLIALTSLFHQAGIPLPAPQNS